MKVSLINPQIHSDEIISTAPFRIEEHVGIRLLASFLRKRGADGQIIYGMDDSDSIQKVLSDISAFSPDLIGITVMSQTHPSVLKYVSSIKKITDIKVVVGGILPSILQEKYLKEFDLDNSIDFLIYGDGKKKRF